MTTSPASELPCPKCTHTTNVTVDTRGVLGQEYIRRRRECKLCGHRFSTVEIPITRYEELTVPRKELDQFERAVTALSKLADRVKRDVLRGNGAVR